MSQPSQPIHFFNRYTQQVEQEVIYGEAPLRFAYENPVGRMALEFFVKRRLFSRWYGWRMDRPASRSRVLPFIEKYGLDAMEFADPPESFSTFNEFFFRKLKPASRPIDPAANAVVFPADGRHLGFQDVSQADGIFVKGQKFDLPELLGDAALAQRYQHGTLVLSRLCPVDYHRFHFPAAGVPGETRSLGAPLYSVSPVALRKNISYLWQNKRTLTLLETADLGTVIVMEIGATNVGSIQQTFTPHQAIAKGSEKGYFAFGGSSTLTIFEPERVKLSDDLVRESGQQRELYARMGDVMGAVC